MRPGFPEVVHHQLTYLGPPGATIEGVQGAGTLDLEFVGGWGPGVAPLVFPDGYGMRMPPNSTMFFQMHYHKTPGPGTGGTDQTKIGLKFYDQQPENVMETLWLVDPVLNIPPGEAQLQVDLVGRLRARRHPLRLHAAHAPARQVDDLHRRVPERREGGPARRSRLRLRLAAHLHADRSRKILPAGTKLGGRGRVRQLDRQPDNPDPAAWVRFGEKTTDEMMVGFIHYTFVDKSAAGRHADLRRARGAQGADG